MFATLVFSGLLRIAVPADSPAVALAAADLAADCDRVFGTPAETVAGARAASRPNITLAIDGKLAGPEAWRVAIDDTGVRISGSDPLGLVYGVYAFSERCLGVDPLWFWKSVPPERRDRVALEPQTFSSGPAKFRYRGWFINDEDLLTEFGTSAGPRHIDYPFYARVIDPGMAERIYEALLRLGGNLIIPASFVDVMNAPEAELVRRAVARGLYVTQHHVEPMGVSHFGFENFWRARGEKKEFRYATDPEAVRTVWRAHARRWRELAGDQVVWQLGMRGRGDRPIWHNDKAITPETAGDFISRAMADQWEIVRAVDPRPQPPATTTLWAEGSELMAAGSLKLPPGITVVFADYGASQEMQRDFQTTPRRPEYRYGAYYHVAFWVRGPHLVQGIAPSRIAGVFRQLESRGDTHYAIVNVSNVREHVLGAHTFIRTAWHGAQRPLAQTLDEFAPAATRPFMEAFHAALVRRADGIWLQDGDCVDATSTFLRQKNPAERAAAVRKIVEPEVLEAAAAKLEHVAAAGDLAAVPERWRIWTRDYFIVQANHLAALYRCVASLARDQPAEAARHVERALAIRAPLATGQWAGWYVGDRKANWPGALARLRSLPAPGGEGRRLGGVVPAGGNSPTRPAGEAGTAAVARLTPSGEHFFFGYYDVPAVGAGAGRHLVHRVPFRDRLPTADDEAELGTIDVGGGGTFRPFAWTRAWNFQQGAMLQWLGDGTGRVFYNEVAPDARGYRGVLHDLGTNARTFTDRALANVSRDGRWGLAIDFDRMHDFRPGYGYALRDDPRAEVPHPKDDGVWLSDLRGGRSRLVLSLAALQERVRELSPLMQQKLLVNHITFNPSATRFVLLLRNFPAPGPRARGQSAWQTVVLTAARDGSDVRILVPPGYASHYHWRDDTTIVFHSDGPQGRQLYEITDAPTPRFVAVDPAFFTRDGHCSYSADGRWMLYDSYPDAQRNQGLYVYDLKRRRGWEIGRFYSPPAAITDVRCDLHPRWLPDGRVSFDSTHESHRGVYVLNLPPLLAGWER